MAFGIAVPNRRLRQEIIFSMIRIHGITEKIVTSCAFIQQCLFRVIQAPGGLPFKTNRPMNEPLE